MYFLERARSDGKSIAGLETVHDQIALFEGLSMDAQAEYLLSSLEQRMNCRRRWMTWCTRGSAAIRPGSTVN